MTVLKSSLFMCPKKRILWNYIYLYTPNRQACLEIISILSFPPYALRIYMNLSGVRAIVTGTVELDPYVNAYL